MNSQEARQEIDVFIADGNAAAALASLRELWNHERSPATAAFVVPRFEGLREQIALQPYRVALMRSFTVEPLVPLLRASAFSAGIDLKIHLSDFNAYAQEILDSESSLYRFNPDAAFLMVQTRDIVPELWKDFADLNQEQVRLCKDRFLNDFGAWLSAFRTRSMAHLIVHNLELPSWMANGILDAQSAVSQRSAIENINQGLQQLASQQTGIYTLNYESLVARHGRLNWHSEQKWLTVRLPLAGTSFNPLVDEWMRFLHPLTGKVAKCLVVDLDNTLWGGVIGEEGMDGIKLGSEYPGAAYQNLQRVLLDLHRRGILLAICSKNNLEDAMEAINRHPGMKLRAKDFSAVRINWVDKSENLRQIAAELNIGTDSLAFLDDNPVERRQVRSALPEIKVLDLPRDFMQFEHAIRDCPLFERLTVSAEDRDRGAIYEAQQEREQLQHSISSPEDFYRSLHQEAEIATVSTATRTRVAQLTNKTNQFNLTTHRWTEQEIAALPASPDWKCFTLQVRDRFGDNGLVGVAILHFRNTICEIDTLLLSCRVIGRTVETALLSFLADQARRSGAETLKGWFRATTKNKPAKNFYPDHGFKVEEQENDDVLWSTDLSSNALPCPEWVRLTILEGDNQ